MDRLINLILRYFEERSRVSCRYLLRFLSALMDILVSNFKSNGILDDIDRSRSSADKQIGTQQVKMQDEKKPGRSTYRVESLINCNVDATKCRADLCLQV